MAKKSFKRYLHEYKFSLGHLILRLLLAGVLSIGFFILMFPFLESFEGLAFEEMARVGEINMWRVVFFYGFFTGIFVFLAFWRKIFRSTAVVLILAWLVGSSIVLIISSNPIEQDLGQPLPAVPTFTGQEVFDAVNSYREERGLTELKLDKTLCNNLAQRYLDVTSGAEENVAHKGLDEWYEENVKPFGEYSVSENYVWAQTPEEVIKAWEGSPGHRLSILDPESKLGCAYATEGHAIIILGNKVIYARQSQNQTQNKVPSRTGKIIPYREWCSGKDISIYENELITKPSSDGNIYTMTQGDWDCYEDYLKNKR